MKSLCLFFIVFVGFSILCHKERAFAQLEIDPAVTWRTLTTPHFQIIFRNSEHELAQATALRLEYAYDQLSLTWAAPTSTIPVLLRTDTDIPNGYATVLPYPHIVLFPVSPSFQESIGEYSDWLYELCLHELIHIFTFEQRQDVVKALYPFFGNILTPNILLPRWWLEGVAVDGESRYSEGGRMRSLIKEAQVRATFKAQSQVFSLTYPSINEVNIPTWPFGNRPYFFGALYWSFLSQKLGNKFSGEISKITGSRAPYALNRPLAETSLITDIEEGFYAMVGSLHKKLNVQMTQDLNNQFSNIKIHSSPFILENQNPTLSPDGKKLVTLARFEDLTRGLVLYERSEPTRSFNFSHYQVLFGQFENPNPSSTNPIPTDLPWASTITRISWLPNSQQFVFDLISPVSRFELRSDIWLFDIKKKKWERLTHKARAREPSASPNGRWIAYIKAEPLRESLVLIPNLPYDKDKVQDRLKVLFSAPSESHLHWPVWIDSENIVVTKKTKNSEVLLLINRQQPRTIHSPCPRVRFTNYIQRQKRLFVTCDQNGTWNVFVTDNLLEANVEWKAATHLETAALTHDFDHFNHTLWLSVVTRNGFQMASLNEDSLFYSNNSAALPPVAPIIRSEYPLHSIDLKTNSVQIDNKEYSPLSFLVPKYWIPLIWVTDKSTAILASTSAFDPTMKHIYDINVSYDTLLGRANHMIGYTYRNSWGNWRLISLDESSYLTTPEQVTQNRVLLGSWTPWIIDNPFLNTTFFVSQAERNLINLNSHQWENGFQVSYRFLQSSARFSVPNRGYLWTTSVSRIQQFSPTSIEAYTLRLSAERFFTQTWGWFAVNRLKFMGYYLDRHSLQANYQQTLSWQIGNMQGGHIMRGYPTGAFFAPKIAQFTFEHWLPGWRVDKGSSEFASYFHQISLGLVSDFLLAEGFGYSVQSENYRRINANQVYSSFGIESVFDFNVGYHFGVQMAVAWYYAPPSDLSPGQNLFMVGFRF